MQKTMTNHHNTFGKGFSERGVNGGADEYFTTPEVAMNCMAVLLTHVKQHKLSRRLFIEPSAGAGVWLDTLPDQFKRAAYDINPQDTRIEQQNFYGVVVPKGCVVFGNPPFGFAAAEAVRFFNHAASGAQLIAFIVPRSFKKQSVQARLSDDFHLLECVDLPAYSFEVNGVSHDVPCCFQIWYRTGKKREIKKTEIRNPWFDFVGPGAADVAVRRVGGQAGRLLSGTDHSVSSTYFLRSKVPLKVLRAALDSIDLTIVDQTAGVRSISKRELVALVSEVLGNG